MRLRKLAVAYSLALATVLVGCGSTSSTTQTETTQETTVEETSETTSEEVTEEASETTEEETTEETSKEETTEATTQEETTQATSEAAGGDVEKALAEYQNILNASPAIEGEPEELNDASFDFEQNKEKYGEHYDMFAVEDINKDGMPELIALTTINFRWSNISVFTYADGKAVLLGNGAPVSIEQNASANGSHTLYICEENHIHSVWRGTNPMGDEEEENTGYAVDGTQLSVIDCQAGESENTVYFENVAKTNNADNVKSITK